MKNIMIDICLVLLILLIGQHIMDRDTRIEDQLSWQMESFESDVASGEMETYYRLAKDPVENEVSQFVSEVSDFSREGVRVIVDALSRAFSGF